ARLHRRRSTRPRFRALALLGRLTSVRVDRFVMQASENLHSLRPEHTQHPRAAQGGPRTIASSRWSRDRRGLPCHHLPARCACLWYGDRDTYHHWTALLKLGDRAMVNRLDAKIAEILPLLPLKDPTRPGMSQPTSHVVSCYSWKSIERNPR